MTDPGREVSGGSRGIEVSSDAPNAAPFEFEGYDLFSGAPVDGLEIYAQRPAILVFMAPWCPACREEAPDLAASAELYDDVNFVVVHGVSTNEEMQAFVEETGMDNGAITHLSDQSGELWRRFNITTQPVSVLVDADGVLTRSTGGLSDHGFARAVERLGG